MTLGLVGLASKTADTKMVETTFEVGLGVEIGVFVDILVDSLETKNFRCSL
jgi:hypothetical protein